MQPSIKDEVEETAKTMKMALIILRQLRKEVGRGPGARELSEAITNFETGSMWMVRAGFAQIDGGDYNPARVYEEEDDDEKSE